MVLLGQDEGESQKLRSLLCAYQGRKDFGYVLLLSQACYGAGLTVEQLGLITGTCRQYLI